MSPNTSERKLRDFAQQILEHEAGKQTPEANEANMVVTLRVFEALRRPLSTLMGSSGFRALMGRALMLACPQAPGLRAVQVRPDGSLEDTGEIRNHEDSARGVELIAQLLGLLVTFIGESLMLGIVLDTWPDLSISDAEPFGESEHDPTNQGKD